MQKALATVWVFGDQLNRNIGALAAAKPETHRVLIIESAGKIASRLWHIQRAHFLITSMRRFALELQQAGFEVDYRHATTMRAGVTAHIAEFSPTVISLVEFDLVNTDGSRGFKKPKKGYSLAGSKTVIGLLAIQVNSDGSMTIEKIPGKSDPKSFTGFSENAKIYVK